MTNQRLGKNFHLCLVKHCLLCSLLLLMIQDASSSADMKCEVKSSCTPSVCQQTDPMTVEPGSNITFNCSIITGELALGMSWNQTLERVQKITKSANLVLQRWNLSRNNDIGSCQCTNIMFPQPLKVRRGLSPESMYEGEPVELECTFSGWPLPHKVSWYTNGKLITNESEGIYQSVKRKDKTLIAKLSFPAGNEKLEGEYTCKAMNTTISATIHLIYECSVRPPTIDAPEVTASTFSNVSLRCGMYSDGNECPEEVFWRLNDNPDRLKSGEKYEIVKETRSACKKDLILFIFNVTEKDEGKYTCHWKCYEGDKKAEIDLKVYLQQPTAATATTDHESVNTTTQIKASWNSTPVPSGSRKDWLLPIIILSAGCAAVSVMLFVRFRFIRKRKSSYDVPKSGLDKQDLINRLFISFSSKDFNWVTENLISVLEKHSIAYSIHSRDFELGRPIVQNMADSVYCSRQVLIVLSENYLASNFCREELHMAVQRGVDTGDSSLILVVIDNLKKMKLPGALRKMNLVDFAKHKKKGNWEGKILCELDKFDDHV